MEIFIFRSMAEKILKWSNFQYLFDRNEATPEKKIIVNFVYWVPPSPEI